MARQASLLVADEIYYNLYGKAILQGIYHGDLTIATDPSAAPQLIFYFMAETDLENPFHSLNVEITLPGGQPIQNMVAIMPPEFLKSVSAGRTHLYYRHPLLVRAPVLRPGKMVAKIIHESGEIVVGAPWIVFTPPTPPMPS